MSDGLPLDQRVSLTIAATSQFTGCALSMIYEYLNDGRLQSYRLGRRRYILVDSVLKLIAEQQAVTPPLNQYRRFGRNAPQQDAGAAGPPAKPALQRIKRPRGPVPVPVP
jgi:hypothetical protein